MRHTEYFGCRVPILAAAMNRVSDVPLAVAVAQAGAFPSISTLNYYRQGALDLTWLAEELDRFLALSNGSTGVLLSMATLDFMSERVQTLVLERGFRFLELFHWERQEMEWPWIRAQMAYLQTWYGCKVIIKVHRARDALELDLSTVIFKGNEGAGRTAPDAGSLEQNFAELRKSKPSLAIIPSGGIATPEAVKHFLDHGALAVGVGTLFAAAEESSVSRATKYKMIEASAADISRFGTLDHRGLVFADVGSDDPNYTRSLVQGIAAPTSGAVFAGKSIEEIREILPVSEIVRRLTSLID